MKRNPKEFTLLRVILAIALTLACVLCFAACSGGGDGEGEATTAGTDGGDGGSSYSGPVTLISEGTLQASIVYQSAANSCIIDTVDYLEREIKDLCDEEIKSVSDALHERADDAFEIIIGSTKYEASSEALSSLSENSYSISVSGKKIILSASNTYLYPEAAKDLIAALKIVDGTVSLDQEYSYRSESYEALSLGANGKSDYTLVYDSRDAEAKAQASAIKLAFSDIGISISSVEDLENVNGKEIIIGDADRDICFEAEHYYKNAWIGRDADGNIAITGDVVCGAEIFIEYIYNLGAGGGNIALLENMFGNFSPDGYGNVPRYTGNGEVELNDSFELSKSYYLIVHGASSGDYLDYIDELLDAGFDCYDEKTLNGNRFATYTDGYNIATVSLIRYTDPATQDRYAGQPSIGTVSYMSIAVDCVENSALPARVKKYDKVTTVQLSTVDTVCGYVIRLEDGRFIVIDGGMVENADSVYKILKDQNKLEGNPVIAAWMITHGHSDHIGAILKFTKSYSKKAVIQSVIHNLPAYSLYYGKNELEGNTSERNEVSNSIKAASEALYKQMGQYYPSADVIVAHAGQKFEFAGMMVDVLFTSENLYGKQMRDTNMSSVMYSLKGTKGRMIVLGDQQEMGCAIMNSIYGSTLKCDIVQVAHHGYNGGDTDMYASMDAKYAIWTNSYEGIISEKLNNTSVTYRNFFDCDTVDVNIAPSLEDTSPTILTDSMTKSQLTKLDIGIKNG